MTDVDAEVLRGLNEVLRSVLDNPDLSVALYQSAKDIEGWDSLNNIRIVVGIERRFQVRLSAGEVQRLQNVGDLVVLLKSKIARR